MTRRVAETKFISTSKVEARNLPGEKIIFSIFIPLQVLPAINTMSSQIPSQLVGSSDITAHVRLITLNRPDKRNALSQNMIDHLAEELQNASSDPDVGAVIITGRGSFFCGVLHGLMQSAS